MLTHLINSGKLSRAEFQTYMLAYPKMTSTFHGKQVKYTDLANKGFVSWTEAKASGMSVEAFRAIDRDNSNHIDAKEFEDFKQRVLQGTPCSFTLIVHPSWCSVITHHGTPRSPSWYSVYTILELRSHLLGTPCSPSCYRTYLAHLIQP